MQSVYNIYVLSMRCDPEYRKCQERSGRIKITGQLVHTHARTQCETSV